MLYSVVGPYHTFISYRHTSSGATKYKCYCGEWIEGEKAMAEHCMNENAKMEREATSIAVEWPERLGNAPPPFQPLPDSDECAVCDTATPDEDER